MTVCIHFVDFVVGRLVHVAVLDVEVVFYAVHVVIRVL